MSDRYQNAVKFAYQVGGTLADADAMLSRLGEYQDDVTEM